MVSLHLGLADLICGDRLIFGLGGVHHLPLQSDRLRLARTALDGGFQAFDVAPAYGNGLAERILGQALRQSGHRDQVEIRSKGGIPVSIYPGYLDHVFFLPRGMEKLTGTQARAYARRDFSPTTLRDGLEGSLRRLGTDYLDTFLLHEPVQPFSRTEWDDVRDLMDRLITAGLIRRWGVAGPRHRYLAGPALPAEAELQLPAKEWFEMLPDPGVKSCVLFSVHSAWSTTAPHMGFRDFVECLGAGMLKTRFIVATRRIERLRSWLSEDA